MASFDPDHALAILLQARFNEEAKKNKLKEKENMPAPMCIPVSKASLVDPDWEVTDPCPDIHGLFIAFNDRFFWGKLRGVEVRWSPKMTSCAGICVYEGRGGLCSVRLSAPLLKLRPRSDLIETLLHEMIHAYLFVTHNNRDREGHGPEFHKHMYRINKEAGTNITVYHSFHAEVKAYQQHWWRCNGPCQHRAPFFGMVKRAMNRAPGRYDIWWADHQASCGGSFVKVREPEDYANKRKGKEGKAKVKDGKDIRNFFDRQDAVKGTNLPIIKSGSNIFGFSNYSSQNNSPAAESGSSINRVTGFKDLGKVDPAIKKPLGALGGGHVLGQGSLKSLKGNRTSTGSPVGRGGMLANRGGGTLVVNKTQSNTKPAYKSPSPDTKLRIDKFKAFTGSGFTLGSSSNVIDRSRSRLLNLGEEPNKKKLKFSEGNKEKLNNNEEIENLNTNDMCKCSVCNKSMLREEIDLHLESCEGLTNVFNNSCVVEDIDEREISDINNKNKVSSCPICSLHIEGDINMHLDECLNTSGIINVFEEPPIEISDSPVQTCDPKVPKHIVVEDDDIEIVESEARVACPICGMRFGESRINGHVNQCLDLDDY